MTQRRPETATDHPAGPYLAPLHEMEAARPARPGENISPTETEGLPRPDYLEERKLLIEAKNAAGDSLDKTALALSGGALLLSVTFLEKIAKPPFTYLPVLAAAWAGFIISVAAVLASAYFSQRAYERALAILDAIYNGVPEAEKRSNPSSRANSACHLGALMGFLIGVGCLVVFSFANLQTRPLGPQPGAVGHAIGSKFAGTTPPVGNAPVKTPSRIGTQVGNPPPPPQRPKPSPKSPP